MSEAPLISASIFVRGFARLIDVAVQLFTLQLAGVLAKQLPGDGLLTLGETPMLFLDYGVGITALVLYSAISEWQGGATFGKFCCQVRAVDTEGGPIGLAAAFVRSLAFLVDGFIFGLIAYSTIARSKRGQRLGDEWAGTLVVWNSHAPASWGLGWVIGFPVSLAWILLSYVIVA